MKKKKMVLGGVVALLAGISAACAVQTDGPVGTTNEAISELSCAYRTITSPNGHVTSSWTMACGGTSATSSDGLYGYTNCTHGYIWEITALDSNGTCGGRVINTLVQPASNPTDQTNCQDTNVTYYLYGLDTVNDIQYAYSTNESNVACTWSSMFGCTCNAQLTDVDLDNWPDGTGGTLSVDGIRIVGQAYNSNLGAYVKVYEAVEEYDYGTCCTGRKI